MTGFSMAHAGYIIGHRGASFEAPENTLKSFKLGYDQGADGDELDIHLTQDGKIVVIHDYDTQRTGGMPGKVVDQTFDELRKINVGDFGKWKGMGFDEKIPTLDEVLAIVPKGKKLYIEIKVHQEILPALEETLKVAPTTPDQTVIITFYLETAAAAKRKFPDRKVYWLVGKNKTTKQFLSFDDLIAKAKGKVDGLDIEFMAPIDAAVVKKVNDAGLSLHVWTVDDAAKAQAFLATGVESVTTNRCGPLRKEIEERK